MVRKNNFAILHFMAALGVMCGHQYVLMGRTAPGLFGMDIHGLSVRVIFVITGYLITESWLNSKSCIEYVGKRFKRIYPPLILCVLLCFLLGAFFSTESVAIYFKYSLPYVWKNILMAPKFDLPGVFTDNIYPNSVNGSLWTLPIEMMCYFSIILLMKISDSVEKKGNLIYAIFVLTVGVIYVLRITGKFSESLIIWGTDWFNAVQVAAYFLAGSLFSKAKLKKYCNLQVAFGLGIVCSLFTGLTWSIVCLPVITYVVLSFAFSENPLFYNFECSICYEMYLYAFPIQQTLIKLIVIEGGFECPPVVMFVASTIITILVALIAHKCTDNLLNKLRGVKLLKMKM